MNLEHLVSESNENSGRKKEGGRLGGREKEKEMSREGALGKYFFEL